MRSHKLRLRPTARHPRANKEVGEHPRVLHDEWLRELNGQAVRHWTARLTTTVRSVIDTHSPHSGTTLGGGISLLAGVAQRKRQQYMSEQFHKRVEIITDFLNSIANLDFERAGQLLAPKAIMTFPFLDALLALQGRTTIVDQLSSTMPLMFDRMEFTYDEWYEVRGAPAVIAEYHSECAIRGTVDTYRNSYISVFRFEGGEISLYREYLNPMRMVGLTPTSDK